MNTVPVSDSPTSPADDAYVHAKDLIGAAIAALSALIHATTDPDTRAGLVKRLLDERNRQRLLPAYDAAAIERILHQYPAKIEAIRHGVAP